MCIIYQTGSYDNEKEKIPLTDVSADINPEFNTNAGNATQDKVFLLSIIEAEKYLASLG